MVCVYFCFDGDDSRTPVPPLTITLNETQQAEAYALALLKKLLVGLDRSYRHAAKEVTRGAGDAGKAAAAQNEAAVKAFLARVGDGVVDGDVGSITGFEKGGKGGLPVASRALEEWVAGREKGALAAFKAGAARFEVRGWVVAGLFWMWVLIPSLWRLHLP